MGGDNQLGAAYGAGRKKINEIELEIRGEAVLRLIQQVEPTLRDGLGEIDEGAFPVGVLTLSCFCVFADKAGARAAACLHVAQEGIVSALFLTIQPHMLRVFSAPALCCPLGCQVAGIVLLPQPQDVLEHIIAADEAAFVGNLFRVARFLSGHAQTAQIHIIAEERGAIVGGAAR